MSTDYYRRNPSGEPETFFTRIWKKLEEIDNKLDELRAAIAPAVAGSVQENFSDKFAQHPEGKTGRD